MTANRIFTPSLLMLWLGGQGLAELDKDALPAVEEGFAINFFVSNFLYP